MDTSADDRRTVTVGKKTLTLVETVPSASWTEQAERRQQAEARLYEIFSKYCKSVRR